MTTLVTGGTGKTGLRLAHLLKNAGYPTLLASRTGNVPEPFIGVTFNWLERSTYENPFKADPNVDRIYLVGPPVLDMLPIVKEFVELAITKGVKRFVLISATATPKGTPPLGMVHEYLADRGVDYAVLRPSWFSENFAVQFLHTIRDRNLIASAAKDGRIPFVSVDDIADVAFKALTDEKSHNTEHIIVGPELYSYDEAAILLSQVLGRQIIHKRLSDDEVKEFWVAFGLPEEYGAALLGMEKRVALGEEEAIFHTEVKEVGKRYLVDYLTANREIWIAK